MRLTWPVVLTFLGALVLGVAIGWWAGSTNDDGWREMRDHPRNAAVCEMGNGVARLGDMPFVDCSGL